MAANELTIEQSSTILKAVLEQVMGKTALAGYNTSDLVTVAQTTLKQDTEKTLTAMSQLMGRSLYSIRPYSRKFPGLQVTNQQYGNHTRKINAIDGDLENDSRQTLTDGASIDQFVVKKQHVLQTNFYGEQAYEKSTTVFVTQLDTALKGPEEFAQFYALQMTNASDILEQVHEVTARAILANFIAGKVTADTGSVIHLLTEYNTLTGQALTNVTVYLPENFQPFIQWVFSRIAALSALLTERTINWHINVTGKEISRHTPAFNQKLYLYAPAQYQMNAMVLANTFHDKYLSMAERETVNFWQNPRTPASILVKPTYLNAADGTLLTAPAAVPVDAIFGILFDNEAMGYTVVNQRQYATPFNARGEYHNIFWHFTERYWNDFTENGIIFLLD